MHNFSGATFAHDGSVLITMKRMAMQNSEHTLFCVTDKRTTMP